ncbi:MAG TPA: metal-dependent hydrolase [Gemmatimonadales bacterium]|nr:metal-dependent hydrolase [Gemmatimonadales bacterium]
MPTPISHAAVGFAIAAWTQPEPPSRKVCVVAAACAALPDIDVLGWPLHLASTSPFGHRAITHSLVFALVSALVATILFFRGDQWRHHRARIAGILGLALLSHPCLDGLSTYSVGVEFFAPFSAQRLRFPWTPLGVPSAGLAGQLIQEALLVLAPAVLMGWLGFRRRGPSLRESR